MPKTDSASTTVTREELIKLLNEDLSREYQAIISYVVYSQVLKGAPYMNIAAELEKHAGEELQHAIVVANQIALSRGNAERHPQARQNLGQSRADATFRPR